LFRLGQRVYIVSDRFEQSLPIGEYGYIIAYERNNDNVYDYIIRIPKLNKHFYVPKEDIEEEETLLKAEVERIEREALIDYALATKNEELFKKIINGEPIELTTDEKQSESQSSADFVKQINLKAWI
jgi:hypothetical protein